MILVQLTFDSVGNVVMESIVPGGSGVFSSATQDDRVLLKAKKKQRPQPLVTRTHQQVHAGKNSLKVKLSPAGIAQLKKNGRLGIKLKVTFTPTGGSPKTSIANLTVVEKPKHKGHH